jgi:hypothetical protein
MLIHRGAREAKYAAEMAGWIGRERANLPARRAAAEFR